MNNASQPRTSLSADATVATRLFRQAAAAGRQGLDPAELAALLSALGLSLAAKSAPDGQPNAVELRISLNNTREFGMVISAGFGGLDAELDEANFRKDRASVYAATELTDAGDFVELFRRTLTYQRMASVAKRDGLRLPDGQLKACFERMLALAAVHSPTNPEAEFVLQSLELRATAMGDVMSVQDALCEFAPPQTGRLPRPIHKIDKLIHPASIGIIGVSSSNMNFGRIILRNLMGSGYGKERMCIIRPGKRRSTASGASKA